MCLVLPASESDIPALTGLIASLFENEPDFAAQTDKQVRGLTMLLAEPERSLVLKAVQDGVVIGMLTVQLVVSTAQGGWSGLMEDVVVAQGFRGKGIGKAMIAQAESWLLSKGATRMQLLADCENAPALAFYGKLGYQPTRMICRRKLFAQDRT